MTFFPRLVQLIPYVLSLCLVFKCGKVYLMSIPGKVIKFVLAYDTIVNKLLLGLNVAFRRYDFSFWGECAKYISLNRSPFIILKHEWFGF